jgi:hypothetical protein
MGDGSIVHECGRPEWMILHVKSHARYAAYHRRKLVERSLRLLNQAEFSHSTTYFLSAVHSVFKVRDEEPRSPDSSGSGRTASLRATRAQLNSLGVLITA